MTYNILYANDFVLMSKAKGESEQFFTKYCLMKGIIKVNKRTIVKGCKKVMISGNKLKQSKINH